MINPTRGRELARVKKLLATATRGHKLLKDKLDELMKQFLDIVRENKQLREEAETALDEAYKSFIIARAVMSEEYMGESLMMAESSVDVSVSEKNIMSVIVPRFKFNTAENEKAETYAPMATPSRRRSLTALSRLFHPPCSRC